MMHSRDLFAQVAHSELVIVPMYRTNARGDCACSIGLGCSQAGRHAVNSPGSDEPQNIVEMAAQFGGAVEPAIDLAKNSMIAIAVDIGNQASFSELQAKLGVLPSTIQLLRRAALGEPPRGQLRGRMSEQLAYIFRIDHSDRMALKNIGAFANGVTLLESGALAAAAVSFPGQSVREADRHSWVYAGRMIPALPKPWHDHLLAFLAAKNAGSLQQQRDDMLWSNGLHPDQRIPEHSVRLVTAMMLADNTSCANYAAGAVLSDPRTIARLREAGADLVPLSDPRTRPLEAALQPGEVQLLNDFHAQFPNFFFSKKAGFRTSEPLLISQLIRGGAPLAYYIEPAEPLPPRSQESIPKKRESKAVAV